ncbi:MAG: hypothetical protein ACRDBG_22845 [Waterburya sp.]
MIELTFSKPIGLNKLINVSRSNKFAAAAAKKKATNLAAAEAKQQTDVSIICRVYMAYEISYSTETTDMDNLNSCLKPILDGIVNVGIIRDDSLKYIEPLSFIQYTKAPRASQFVKVRIFINQEEFQQYVSSQIL